MDKRTPVIVELPEKDRHRFKTWCLERNTSMAAEIRKHIYHCLQEGNEP